MGVDAPQRLRALDGLRGLSALLVCLFHFPAAGPIAETALVRGGWLAVDFFFLLSGFVIAAGWGGRLNGVADLPRFFILRLARIWPLHAAMLLLFLVVELVGAALGGGGLMQRAPFGAGHGLGDWWRSLFLLGAFGLTDGEVWNVPAWSIAAEFWSWVIFGISWVWGGPQRVWLLAGLALLSWALMHADGGGIARTFDGGFIRALCGFFAGALLQSVPHRAWRSGRGAPLFATAVEAAALLLVFAFIAAAPASPTNLAAPLVFGLAVHVFARGDGLISRLLKTAPLQRLGLLSSALYLVHTFVQARLGDALVLLPRLVEGTPQLLTKANGKDVFGRTSFEGVMLTGVMLALTMAAAGLAWRLVEEPVRTAARRRWLYPARASSTLTAEP
jgi:peptidoglycan/LPS O-acetylase OafA/YrhL